MKNYFALVIDPTVSVDGKSKNVRSSFFLVFSGPTEFKSVNTPVLFAAMKRKIEDTIKDLSEKYFTGNSFNVSIKTFAYGDADAKCRNDLSAGMTFSDQFLRNTVSIFQDNID